MLPAICDVADLIAGGTLAGCRARAFCTYQVRHQLTSRASLWLWNQTFDQFCSHTIGMHLLVRILPTTGPAREALDQYIRWSVVLKRFIAIPRQTSTTDDNRTQRALCCGQESGCVISSAIDHP